MIEMLVVIACVVIVVAFLLPARHTPGPSSHFSCMNNLRQIGISFLMYTDENHGKFPIRTSITNGGSMEYLDRNQTFPHYPKFPWDTNITRFFVCPDDKTRKAAKTFEGLADTNISYFLSANVSTNNASYSILSGDRHLQVDGQPVRHGTLVFTRNMNVAWTPELHRGRGGLGFADGHVEFSRSTDLNPLIQREGLATNRFSVP